MRGATTKRHRPARGAGQRRFALVVAFSLLSLTAACGDPSPASTTATPQQSAAAAPDNGGAPALTANRATGGTVAVPDGKPAVVYFFAPSCYSCIAGTKAVAAAQSQAPEAADYVAVNLDPGQKTEDVAAFLNAADGAALLRTTDTEGALATRFGVRALGTLLVLDANGAPAYTGVDPPSGEITTAVKRAAA